ncbi:transposase [Massilia niastensis]|uniref:transposase n=1 Tax=Massilia niastensis TaxID=544911 RepID=UPI000360CCDF|nr:transposase [Massilia niastensis]
MKKKQLPSKREIIPASPTSAPKPRATFTDEFKRKAVSRLRSGGQSATDLAIELGIQRSQLYKWAKKLDEQSPGDTFRSPGRPAVSELSEVEQLRRDLAKAQEELAILKKFDAYLTRLKK